MGSLLVLVLLLLSLIAVLLIVIVVAVLIVLVVQVAVIVLVLIVFHESSPHFRGLSMTSRTPDMYVGKKFQKNIPYFVFLW